MQGILYEDYYVFPYGTMLHTTSPLLKELYCESHRREPWAVYGSEKRYGNYMFPNILYIPAHERREILTMIPDLLESRPEYVDSVIRRFSECGRQLQKTIAQVRRGNRSRRVITQLLDQTARFLSCGIFKEVFEYREAVDFLGRFMPIEKVSEQVLQLYQPRCLAHYLKYELHLLYYSEKYATDGRKDWVDRCIRRGAHLTRFFVEDTPYDDPDTMQAEMEKVMETHGGNPESIREHRRILLANHQDALRNARKAEHDILEMLDTFGTYTLQTKFLVLNTLSFIRFIASIEELKHIFTVQAARRIKQILMEKGLPVETSASTDLLEHLE